MKSDKICCINHTRIEIRQVTFMLTACLYVLHVCADELYVCVCVLRRFSPVQLCATLWTGACQAPVSLGFPRQEYWSGLPCAPPGDLPNPGIEPRSPTLQAVSLLSEPSKKPQTEAGPSVKSLQRPVLLFRGYRGKDSERDGDLAKVTQPSQKLNSGLSGAWWERDC